MGERPGHRLRHKQITGDLSLETARIPQEAGVGSFVDIAIT